MTILNEICASCDKWYKSSYTLFVILTTSLWKKKKITISWSNSRSSICNRYGNYFFAKWYNCVKKFVKIDIRQVCASLSVINYSKYWTLFVIICDLNAILFNSHFIFRTFYANTDVSRVISLWTLNFIKLIYFR